MTLSEEQKAWIVIQYARMRSAWQIRRDFKEIWGGELDRKQVHRYNPASSCNYGRGMQKWQGLFDEEREKFLDQVNRIPIANLAVRLDRLETMCVNAMEKGNSAMAANLIEQAAKEVGGLFTNRREIEADVEARTKGQTNADFGSDEARARLADILASAIVAAQGAGLTKH
ncbi:MAG: hypothetical protein A2792_03485 [Sphingomonadales bacterium RIFCSPHIGHO2_01_FULL_65_20]|nr:MAG: hypothetical protein A2792_03485 [Sphingomonadales bacterium RIFCSPHIGHO2_01_FULL_65_20]